ncbi:MAG: hypothetical protein JW748_15675 [Anaerolineales bacterium]|nr:hypothetical protein [Anaerolineales bacterium]
MVRIFHPAMHSVKALSCRNILLGIPAAAVILSLMAGCASPNRNTPTFLPSATLTNSTPTPRPPMSTRTPTITRSATPTATRKWPLTIVFYGDSLLKIGEVGRQGKSGFSLVDDLRIKLDPAYHLILENYGGRGAKWAFENLERTVLPHSPDTVTLWWGFNDLLGCPGFFDRSTNVLIPEKLDWLIERHVGYLRNQIDVLLEKHIPVLLITASPVDGWLPWTHFDENNALVWELDYRCDYNLGLERQVEAERLLAEAYRSAGESVHLVDAWNLFEQHRGEVDMYVDIMHPGPAAADLIAEEWLRAFAQTGEIVRRRGA